MKIIGKVQVKSRLGLHTRPAMVIVKALQNCKSEVFFIYKKERVNAKSILSLLMLAAQKNAKISVEVEGEDAQETMNRIIDIFENELGDL